jgi:DNA-binding NarL/FixJ family response regulator
MFRPLGISSGAERLYRLLIGEGPIQRENLLVLAFDAGVTSPERVLADLLHKSLVYTTPFGMVKANPPGVMLLGRLHGLEARLGQIRVEIDALSDLNSRYTVGASGDPVVGREAVILLRDSLWDLAHSELRAIRAPGAPEHIRVSPAQGPPVMRIILSAKDAQAMATAVALTNRGSVHVRVSPSAAITMTIADGTHALVEEHRLDSTGHPVSSGIWLTSAAIIAALSTLFEEVWLNSRPWLPDNPASERASVPLDDEQRSILAMVGAGFTDEAIARHMQMSKRSLQRRIRDLRTLLGASSRLELAFRAAATLNDEDDGHA